MKCDLCKKDEPNMLFTNVVRSPKTKKLVNLEVEMCLDREIVASVLHKLGITPMLICCDCEAKILAEDGPVIPLTNIPEGY